MYMYVHTVKNGAEPQPQKNSGGGNKIKKG